MVNQVFSHHPADPSPLNPPTLCQISVILVKKLLRYANLSETSLYLNLLYSHTPLHRIRLGEILNQKVESNPLGGHWSSMIEHHKHDCTCYSDI